MRVIGIDPGTQITGWGVVESHGNRLLHIAHGCVRTAVHSPLPERLGTIHAGITRAIGQHQPAIMAVEEVFMAENPQSAIKLGHARGVAIVAGVALGIAVHEYATRLVKKSVVGYGQADKHQVQEMIRMLLNLSAVPLSDAADALAVAICHIHHAAWSGTMAARHPFPGV